MFVFSVSIFFSQSFIRTKKKSYFGRYFSCIHFQNRKKLQSYLYAILSLIHSFYIKLMDIQCTFTNRLWYFFFNWFNCLANSMRHLRYFSFCWWISSVWKPLHRAHQSRFYDGRRHHHCCCSVRLCRTMIFWYSMFRLVQIVSWFDRIVFASQNCYRIRSNCRFSNWNDF